MRAMETNMREIFFFSCMVFGEFGAKEPFTTSFFPCTGWASGFSRSVLPFSAVYFLYSTLPVFLSRSARRIAAESPGLNEELKIKN
jgi:hypothetical protein